MECMRRLMRFNQKPVPVIASIKVLVFTLMQGFLCSSNAQSITTCLEIDSIQTEYTIYDEITFYFRNNCNEKLFISISLEKKVNDRWLLFAQDIFQIPSIHKVENVILLKENETDRKEKWKIKRTIYRKGYENMYRFRYNIRKKNMELVSTQYSNVFLLRDRRNGSK